MWADILALDTYKLLLIFMRMAGCFMFIPGFGDIFVTPQARLGTAMIISVLLLPIVGHTLPPMPSSALLLGIIVVGEIIAGVFIGLFARMIMTALDMAGQIIAFNMSLSNAFVFNPSLAVQGTLVGSFLTVGAILLIFATDGYQLLLRAMVDSYTLLIPGDLPATQDMAETISRLVADTFRLGVQISAPLLVVGVLFNVGMGIVSRLVPQIQVFFISIPVQLVVLMSIFAATLTASLMWFMQGFRDLITPLLAGY